MEYELAEKFEERGITRRRVHITADGKSFYMDFHFKTNKGSTTIDCSGGNEKELRKEIANFIVIDEECIIGDVKSKNKWFVAKRIDYEDFKEIVELIKESDYCQELCSYESSEGADCWKLKGNYNENLTIFYYKTTNKAVLQGRPLMLFSEASMFVTELVEVDEIPRLFNDNYNIEISKENIMEQYECLLPNSFNSI
ncbi:MAG: type II toxin-antitoxin system RnlA family toxin [Halanaerobiales bacterium]|nr:type II toxin-antitoxin system RnlA family toxin [Halanaerobiales bacterium]